MPSIVVEIFREGLAEVKEAVREVSSNVNQLRGETVSRHDYERFLDRYHIEWAAGLQKHDADIKAANDKHDADIKTLADKHDADIQDVKKDAEDRAKEARTFRIALIGIGTTAVLGVAGLLEQYIQHRH